MARVEGIEREVVRIGWWWLSLHGTRVEGNVRGSVVNLAEIEAGWLEDDTLRIAFALPLTFDTIPADRPFLTTLDATLAAGKTARLRSFARQLSTQRVRRTRHVCLSRRVVGRRRFAP